MPTAIREYNANLDSKKRITLRISNYMYYHVQELKNDAIMLEPRELTAPFEVSAHALSMMDHPFRTFVPAKSQNLFICRHSRNNLRMM